MTFRFRISSVALFCTTSRSLSYAKSMSARVARSDCNNGVISGEYRRASALEGRRSILVGMAFPQLLLSLRLLDRRMAALPPRAGIAGSPRQLADGFTNLLGALGGGCL